MRLIKNDFEISGRGSMQPITSDEYFEQYIEFKLQLENSNRGFQMEWSDKLPILNERTESLTFDKHYVYHVGWAARILARLNPEKHVDISSFHYFSVIISAFIQTEYYDYRPLPIMLSNLQSKHADLTKLQFPDNSISSLSCMHVVEHIGLGRYGDPIDPNGDLKAISELKRVLAPNGYLLFVVPVGKARIQFNGQRIYSYDQVSEYFQDLTLLDYSLISGHENVNGIIQNASKDQTDKEVIGCGCFLFKKLRR